jgi:transketolase
VKPLDVEGVAAAAAAVEGRIVVVEDHRLEGGLGSAVAEAPATHGQALRLAHLAVRGMPGSASPEEQRAAAGIDAAAIAAAVRRLAAGEAGPDAPLQASPAGRGDGL